MKMRKRIRNSKQINGHMQQGYNYAMSNDSVQACKEWKKAWSAIISVMDAGSYRSIEDFHHH